ncbi:hypothetical protein ABTK05_21985, partial [Acinetobacter baumannii]
MTDPVDVNSTHLDPEPKTGGKRAVKKERQAGKPKRAARAEKLDVAEIPFENASEPKAARKTPAARKAVQAV